MGSFTGIEGYIFNSASPSTVLREIKDNEQRAVFVCQVLCGKDLEKDFGPELHMHGFEAQKILDRTGFGAHFYKAKVSGCAIGIFSLVEETQRT